MKKQVTKLSLSRETLRALAAPTLQDAAGAATDHRSFCDLCLTKASQCMSYCPAQC